MLWLHSSSIHKVRRLHRYPHYLHREQVGKIRTVLPTGPTDLATLPDHDHHDHRDLAAVTVIANGTTAKTNMRMPSIVFILSNFCFPIFVYTPKLFSLCIIFIRLLFFPFTPNRKSLVKIVTILNSLF